ncbi:MAG: hypothetical protein NZ480_07185 [Bdellovibrionaceae bacterium]|nr:hypothetical protein [Pseudobdellovibrionaceae bacterium]MDW8191245.1 hypothetical protein [Pseudobdellovibrionaceae bacterium]
MKNFLLVQSLFVVILCAFSFLLEIKELLAFCLGIFVALGAVVGNWGIFCMGWSLRLRYLLMILKYPLWLFLIYVMFIGHNWQPIDSIFFVFGLGSLPFSLLLFRHTRGFHSGRGLLWHRQ